MMKTCRRTHRGGFVFLGFLGFICLLVIFSACKTPTAPEEGEADIIIYNRHGKSLNIYMNGSFLWVLNDMQNAEIDNVARGEYVFEAWTTDDSRMVNSIEFDVSEKIDYVWNIGDPADINIINSSGKDLQIFMDGIYQFQLPNGESRWISDVPHGDHLLKAFRSDNGRDYASITIKIQKDLDYTWTIK